MPGLVYFSGCLIGTEKFNVSIILDMVLIAVGVVVCAFGEENLIVAGLIIQLTALLFEATRLTLVQVRFFSTTAFAQLPRQIRKCSCQTLDCTCTFRVLHVFVLMNVV